MLNIFFLTYPLSILADENSERLYEVKFLFSLNPLVNLNCTPEEADAIILQEPYSFKDFRYIKKLKADPIISKYANKTFTINNDTHGTGLLMGLYTGLSRKRYNSKYHCAVPYTNHPNELVLKKYSNKIKVKYLASWRGNPKSHKIRRELISIYGSNKHILIETTNSWMDHKIAEKQSFVDLIRSSKFSICPSGWAPGSYRIYESMALARCPVIIADGYVAPDGPDWETFSLICPEKNLKNLKSFLESKEDSYVRLGLKAYESWLQYFSPEKIYQYYADKLLYLIKENQNSTNEDHVKRWESFKMYYNNNWTLTQRIVNKIKKLLQEYNIIH